MMNKERIVRSFNNNKHSTQFIEEYSRVLKTYRYMLLNTIIQEERDSIIKLEWEFKRWFWSFLEHAASHHTKFVVDSSAEPDYDRDLVLKSLKSFGIEVRKETSE